MAHLLKIFVCDSGGRGLFGQKVNLYNGDPVRTDSSGFATLIAEGKVSVYVNGFTVYNGNASSAPNPIVYQKK